MKKLSLIALQLGATELLSREQLKQTLAGVDEDPGCSADKGFCNRAAEEVNCCEGLTCQSAPPVPGLPLADDWCH
jgi:hypothetical protein